ncbi:hypothetical protein DGG96_16790 [Legionella qingyii]|uniref:Uncharacterized protein n=1 Tax=Legionella qingyii TaxID=2184757 RepID=A0A317U1X1_9GAMM|nr:hypothetical protein DGG96_16790 [Legionella qingyii]
MIEGSRFIVAEAVINLRAILFIISLINLSTPVYKVVQHKRLSCGEEIDQITCKRKNVTDKKVVVVLNLETTEMGSGDVYF